MGQEIHLRRGECGRTLHKWNLFRLKSQPKPLHSILRGGRHALDDSVKPVSGGLQRIGWNFSFTNVAKKDSDEAGGLAAYNNTVSQVRMIYFEARLNFRRCVRHNNR